MTKKLSLCAHVTAVLALGFVSNLYGHNLDPRYKGEAGWRGSCSSWRVLSERVGCRGNAGTITSYHALFGIQYKTQRLTIFSLI